jgi:hypothetical protein
MSLYKRIPKMIPALMFSAIVMATPLMARDLKKAFSLSDGATVSGTALKGGEYTIEFSESAAGEAAISRNGRVVVRTPYRLVALSAPAKQDEVHSRIGPDGAQLITSVVFRHSTASVVFE